MSVEDIFNSIKASSSFRWLQVHLLSHCSLCALFIKGDNHSIAFGKGGLAMLLELLFQCMLFVSMVKEP